MNTSTTEMRVSDEASAEGLRLTREAGHAYQRMVRCFIEQISHCGREQQAGDYRIGIALEPVVVEFQGIDLQVGREP